MQPVDLVTDSQLSSMNLVNDNDGSSEGQWQWVVLSRLGAMTVMQLTTHWTELNPMELVNQN